MCLSDPLRSCGDARGGTVASAIGSARHVVCKRSKPAPPTADAACIAIDTATQDRYLCKDQAKQHWLPLVEWLSQFLAKRSGLLIPDCFLVELEADPGKYMFGSRWEGGAEQFALGMVAKVTNPEEFSAIHAFDLLIHNVDRHLNNYLYLQLAGDTVVKAVDHSRCLCFSGWPMPAPPPAASTNTMTAKSHWIAEAPWNAAASARVIDGWRQIPAADVQAVFDEVPADWVQPAWRHDFTSWWGSEAWADRIDQVVGALP